MRATAQAPQASPAPPDHPSARRLWLQLAGLTVLVTALCAAAIAYTYQQKQATEAARLLTIVDLKTQQVADWLQERLSDTRLIHASQPLASVYRRWRETGDPASYGQLQKRLADFGHHMSFHAVMLLDERGEMLWESAGLSAALTPDMRALLVKTASSGTVRWVGPYRDTGGVIHLDFVATLPVWTNRPNPIVVVHTDDADYLPRKLREWPVPTASGEIILFRRQGEQVLYLNDLRHRQDAALQLQLPLAQPHLLSARILKQSTNLGRLITGVDYRGAKVSGIGRQVPGTDWFLLAKLDHDELYAEARRDALLITLAGLLALIASAGVLYAGRQRQHLAVAQAVQQSQAESLRSLQLLAAIADSSADAIFAKDLDNRFTLFNRAAQQLIGKTQADALGHDETALFPPEQAARQLTDNRRVMDENVTLTFQEDIPTAAGKRILLTTKGPLHDSEGRVIGLYVISRDITEHEQANAALRREVALNQRYLDTVQTIMVALDAEGRITMLNRKGCEVLGRTEDELLGRNWFAACLPQPEGMETVFPVFRQIMAGELEAAEYFENVILCRDGRQCLFAWRNACLTDDEGRISGTLSSGEDITERRGSEVALQRQTEVLKERNAELERFNRLTVGRELDMIRLKQEVNALSTRLGQAPPYGLDFLGANDADAHLDGDRT